MGVGPAKDQPSFVPLDILIGKLENPCSLAEVWKTKGAGSAPLCCTASLLVGGGCEGLLSCHCGSV